MELFLKQNLTILLITSEFFNQFGNMVEIELKQRCRSTYFLLGNTAMFYKILEILGEQTGVDRLYTPSQLHYISVIQKVAAKQNWVERQFQNNNRSILYCPNISHI